MKRSNDVGQKLGVFGSTTYYLKRRLGRPNLADPVRVIGFTTTGKRQTLKPAFRSFLDAHRFLSYYIVDA